MRSLSAQNMLQIWETGQNQHPIDRAMTMLSFAYPEKSVDELASLSIGQRDTSLLTLREITLGDKMESYAECPQCAERLEFTVNVADIRLTEPIPAINQEYLLTSGNLQLRFRLPNSKDLAAVVGYQDVNKARYLIGQRCVLEVNRDGVALDDKELSPDLMTLLAQQMAECDPQAEILLNLTCPACNHHWQILFDIVAFFWSEISVQAKRLLREVHTLARFYGWREADILAMSAVRRQFYLDLAG
ncbi:MULTISPECIES: phage baseplate protein [unclassified Nodularia (in: cyanobacteria)]|uniref:T4 family baseplate hub assembly chaperone n=1 Tax=unclassified Nodularia (in: cyanobacteria) TaxID=2656917 RepID=UPI00188027CE|nr:MULTISPECIES: phage baseplate protein [unclassified Nodularia (in: cyanobacteria)]MBE9199616.1 phage baseplate protein [Nodularia sp. LEGE 06071]MCC2694945.1 phage baseplate protein [Nodularia sp. LEGE 04288]